MYAAIFRTQRQTYKICNINKDNIYVAFWKSIAIIKKWTPLPNLVYSDILQQIYVFACLTKLKSSHVTGLFFFALCYFGSCFFIDYLLLLDSQWVSARVVSCTSSAFRVTVYLGKLRAGKIFIMVSIEFWFNMHRKEAYSFVFRGRFILLIDY